MVENRLNVKAFSAMRQAACKLASGYDHLGLDSLVSGYPYISSEQFRLDTGKKKNLRSFANFASNYLKSNF